MRTAIRTLAVLLMGLLLWACGGVTEQFQQLRFTVTFEDAEGGNGEGVDLRLLDDPRDLTEDG